MNKAILGLILLLPLFAFGQRSSLSKKYPKADWKDLSTWPNTIDNEQNEFILVVVGGGGCFSYTPIRGRKPTQEEIKKWGAFSAWYEPTEKTDFSGFGIYGPYFRWGYDGEVEDIRFSDGKGTIRQYDKKGDLFRFEKQQNDGSTSIFYIGKYGREALEFRERDRTYFQHRKPCSEQTFKDIKEEALKRFELHKPIDKYYP